MADEETKPLVPKEEKEKVSLLKNQLKRVRVMFNYLSDDVKRDQFQFKIAIFAVFLIIAFIAILVNARGLMVVMFIGITEDAVGDSDFYITSINSQTNTANSGNDFASRFMSNFMNISSTIPKLDKVPELLGSSPRIILPGIVFNKNDSQKNTSVYAVIGDSLTENGYGIGRALRVQALKGAEAYVMKSIDNMAELKGQSFIFKMDILRYLRSISLVNGTNSFLQGDREIVKSLVVTFLPTQVSFDYLSFQDLTGQNIPPQVLQLIQFPNVTISLDRFINYVVDTLLDIFYTELEVTPQTIIESPKGKWPDTLGNVLFLERSFYLNYFEKNMNNSLQNLVNILTRDLLGDDMYAPVSNGIPSNPLADPEEFAKEQVTSMIQEQLNLFFVKPITDGFRQLNISDKAMTICTVAKDKAEIYGSFISYKKSLIDLSNKVIKALGDVDRYQLLAPMYFGYEALAFVAIFIQNIIYMILVLLLIMSTVLLASLMVFSIDQKTYEFGMLRALGLIKSNIVLMLIIQGTIFAVCGWAFGIILSWTISVLLQIIFYLDIRLNAEINFDYVAWIVSAIFGFCMPVIVNIISIRSALSDSIKDSLDLYHRTINTLTVIFIKLKRLGINRTVLLVSAELAIYGFLFYYVAPLLFFYNRLDLFIYLFNTILLATIIAMTILANIFQEYLEVALAWMCLPLIWKQKSLISVVMKNIQAHRPSNRKTSLMLTLCVCFIIFCGSGIHTQINSIISAVIILNGSDLSIYKGDSRGALDEFNLRKYLDQPKIAKNIVSYSFMASSLDKFSLVDGTQLTPKSFYPEFNATIYGVDENFTKTFYSQYYTPRGFMEDGTYSTLSNGVKDGFSMLFDDSENKVEVVPIDPNKVYSQTGPNQLVTNVDMITLKAVIPTGLVELTSIDVGTSASLKISVNGHSTISDVKIVHTADKVPGLSFSQYVLSVLQTRNMVISMKDYSKALQFMKTNVAIHSPGELDKFMSWQSPITELSTYGVPKNVLMIKLNPDITIEERDVLKNGINNLLESSDSLVDSLEILDTTDKALQYLLILNVLIAALTCIISFFMLLISLVKKIKDNIWELGVLRSIGLTTRQIYWIYSIETGSVIFSSLILGTGVGLLISWIGTYFYFIFFEVDLGLGFPVTEFMILMGFLLITTIVTSYVGLKRFAHLTISKLLKGLV